MIGEEYRKGNYIWGISDRVEIITELRKDTVITDHFLPEKLSAPFETDYDFIEPIILTEKLLLNLKFERVVLQEDERYCHFRLYFDRHVFSIYFVAGNMYDYKGEKFTGFFFDKKNGYLHIRYLHELQNLFYILTGGNLILDKKMIW